MDRLRAANPRDFGVVAVFVALAAALAATSDVFLTQRNLVNTLDAWAPTGIIACGLTLVTIAGGFDLSVSAIYAVAGILAVKTVLATSSPLLGVLAAMLAGLGIGIANGALTTVARVNPFVATLGTSIITRGVAIAITGGFIIGSRNDAFTALARGEALGVKYTIFVLLTAVLLTSALLNWTTFGRYVYASGGNAEAARLAGVPVRLTHAATFAISGLFASVAGMLVAARADSAQPNAGLGLEFTAIAAVVVGGNSLFGGQGAIWRTALGIALLALIRNGFNLLGVDPTYQRMTEGAIIILAVAIDEWTRVRHR